MDYIVFQLAGKDATKVEWIENHVTYLKAMTWFMFGQHSNKAQEKYFEWQRQRDRDNE